MPGTPPGSSMEDAMFGLPIEVPRQPLSRRLMLTGGALLIALIAVCDWRNADNIPLGFLYLLPMLILGRVLRPWQTLTAAVLCTVLAELFDAFEWDLRSGVPRDILYFAAFTTVGLFVYTANRNRQTMLAQMLEIERQSEARCEAENQLKFLIESSPAAILTTNADGTVLMANEAAHRMLALPSGSLPGRLLQPFFPALSTLSRNAASQQFFRAVMQSRGHREDGETFMAEICFSTYATGSGARLAALILDASEEMRTREESSLHQMLAGSRIAVGAVSHEIRNVCGAISVVHHNLARSPALSASKDFEALGNLVLALEKIASVDLLQYPEERSEVDVTSVLDDLRIVIAPSLAEAFIEASWQLSPQLPAVWADRTNLMQIFLNLTTNSIRALSSGSAHADKRVLSIVATHACQRVCVHFTDNGGGVPHPDELFRPFQPGAQATGLGLYLSRAFARSFGGDLRYLALPGQACFVVELPVAQDEPA